MHQAHFQAIVEAASLKEGNAKGLRYLHDVVNQHLWALKAMDYDPSRPFITSVIQLKLDQATVFKWQWHTQDFKEVPHCQVLLHFLDLRAQASKDIIRELDLKVQMPAGEKRHYSQTLSYTVSVDNQCMACKLDRHPLYACKKFKSLPMSKC